MDGTTLLTCIAIGVVLGAASSVLTRRVSTRAGVVFAIACAVVGLAVIVASGALLPIVGAMLAFSVVASLLDPRPTGMFSSRNS